MDAFARLVTSKADIFVSPRRRKSEPISSDVSLRSPAPAAAIRVASVAPPAPSEACGVGRDDELVAWLEEGMDCEDDSAPVRSLERKKTPNPSAPAPASAEEGTDCEPESVADPEDDSGAFGEGSSGGGDEGDAEEGSGGGGAVGSTAVTFIDLTADDDHMDQAGGRGQESWAGGDSNDECVIVGESWAPRPSH